MTAQAPSIPRRRLLVGGSAALVAAGLGGLQRGAAAQTAAAAPKPLPAYAGWKDASSLIVPGYTGVNNIKYVKRLAFTAQETDALTMSHGYRLSPPGTKGEPTQPSVQETSAKSWINGPSADDAPHGGPGADPRRCLRRPARGGQGRGLARRRQDLGRGTIRRPGSRALCVAAVRLPARLAPGTYTLVSRATDAAGNVQPEKRFENAAGYNNSWADHALAVTVS